ncbi:hypothetical protein LCGC14_0976350 [marine sediment metagenome]|uniref:Exonuclease domain-containing protein n=1 Tax=marine sediment metagenome TaxID=412755 RepID=A0A0F9QTG4_9ZZZZ
MLKDHNKCLNGKIDESRVANKAKNVNYHKVAVIDLETTGLKPIRDLILEIGIIELNLVNGEIKVIFESFVKEPKFGEAHRKSWIFNNSDIIFEDIENAPSLGFFKTIINSIFNKYPLTAFNKSFDFGFLKARGFSIQKELPCIMRSATNVCRVSFPNGRKGYKFPTCQEAWDFFFPNINCVEKHRAADDAILEAKILFELYSRGQFPI